jgi:hypothetical protein
MSSESPLSRKLAAYAISLVVFGTLTVDQANAVMLVCHPQSLTMEDTKPGGPTRNVSCTPGAVNPGMGSGIVQIFCKDHLLNTERALTSNSQYAETWRKQADSEDVDDLYSDYAIVIDRYNKTYDRTEEDVRKDGTKFISKWKGKCEPRGDPAF